MFMKAMLVTGVSLPLGDAPATILILNNKEIFTVKLLL